MIISTQRTISMGHRLASYKGICSSPHGHNIRVVITVDSIEDFLDFKFIDGILEQQLAAFDHAMVLEEDDPLVETLRQFGFRLVVLTVAPTTENIAKYIFRLMSGFGAFRLINVTVHETDKYSATCVADSDIRRIE